jgi:L-cystine uptake protein TcyP (sodium:dicarboxylate symporter family)
VTVPLELIGIIAARRVGQVKDVRRALLVVWLALVFRFVVHVILLSCAATLLPLRFVVVGGFGH